MIAAVLLLYALGSLGAFLVLGFVAAWQVYEDEPIAGLSESLFVVVCWPVALVVVLLRGARRFLSQT